MLTTLKSDVAAPLPKTGRHRWTWQWRWWQVGLLYFGLTSLFTFPLILHFSTSLPGELVEDRDQNMWNLWWVRESLLHFRNPFTTDYIYYPDGVSLYFHTLHPLNGLISTPVQLLFGMVVAYNFVVFFSFIVAGIGTFLLINYLCRHPLTALLASLIFVFAPYHIATLRGIMQLISLEWIPLYILFLLKASGAPSRARVRNGLWATFFLVCIALTDWYYTLYVLGFTLLYSSWLVLDSGWSRWRPGSNPARLDPDTSEPGGNSPLRLVAVGMITGLFVVVISPVVVPMLSEMSYTRYFLPDPNDTRKFSADLTAFLVPPTTSTFLGGLKFPANYVTGPLAGQVYLGYSVLALSVIGLIASRRTWFWGLTALVCWLLALGPALRLNGPQPGWVLPYSLIENWPIVKITRSPDRFVVLTMLGLAVCAGYGLNWLFERVGQGKRPRLKTYLAAGLVALLITGEFLQIPYPLRNYHISPFFEQLKQDQSDYALVELPPQGGFWSGAPRMVEQTVHSKRIFDGYISREYDHPFQISTPGFRELATLKLNQDIDRPPPGQSANQNWHNALSYYQVRYIILRLPQTAKEATVNIAAYRRIIEQVVPEGPIYKDSIIEAYPMVPPARKFPFIEIGKGWYEAEPSNPAGTSFHRWTAGKADLKLNWEGPGFRPTRLCLTAGTLIGLEPARLLLDDQPIWFGTLSPDSLEIEVWVQLAPGSHRLEMHLDGQAQSPHSLGLNNDKRRLLYYLSDIILE